MAVGATTAARAVCACKTFPILHNASRQQQRRWAHVRDVRFVTTQQASVGVTDRYRQKLQQKAREAGVGDDVDKLKEAYRDRIALVKKKAIMPGLDEQLNTGSSSQPNPTGTASFQPPPAAPQASSSKQQPKPTPAKGPAPGPKIPGLKTLSSFLDMEKTRQLPPREVEAIWRLRHAQNSSSLCAAIPSKTWSSMQQMARRHPLFILPGLPKAAEADSKTGSTSQAAEAAAVHLLQWTFPSPTTATVIFTHLAEYKLRGEYTQPHTTITHHTDLMDDKGLVLSEGTVLPSRGVTVDEAKWLVMNMQKFYNTGEVAEEGETSAVGRELKVRRRALLEKFARGDDSFNLEELIEETERMG